MALAERAFFIDKPETRQGRYQVRYAYAGSQTIAGGSIVQRIQITRRLIFG